MRPSVERQMLAMITLLVSLNGAFIVYSATDSYVDEEKPYITIREAYGDECYDALNAYFNQHPIVRIVRISEDGIVMNLRFAHYTVGPAHMIMHGMDVFNAFVKTGFFEQYSDAHKHSAPSSIVEDRALEANRSFEMHHPLSCRTRGT